MSDNFHVTEVISLRFSFLCIKTLFEFFSWLLDNFLMWLPSLLSSVALHHLVLEVTPRLSSLLSFLFLVISNPDCIALVTTFKMSNPRARKRFKELEPMFCMQKPEFNPWYHKVP